MSLTVTSAHEGRTAIIVLETYDEDDNRTDADDTPVITISRSDSELVDPIVLTTMLKFDLGGYKYYWDTTGVIPGQYIITATYNMDSHPQALKTVFTVAK